MVTSFLLVNRRSPDSPEAATHGLRRATGRKESTERVSVRAEGFESSGWTLNVSQGGLRAIVELRLELDQEYTVLIGEEPQARRARVVWTQEEADGQIVGLKYLDVDASVPPQGREPSGTPLAGA